MAHLEELKLSHRLFMKAYRFYSVEWSSGAHLGKPLGQSKLALITTAALHLPSQAAFDLRVQGGDSSFREISETVNIGELKIAHASSAFDQSGAWADRNLVFPLDRFKELVQWGCLGSLNHRHFSFMGSITAPGKLVSETAPAVASLLHQDHVDAVLLVPA